MRPPRSPSETSARPEAPFGDGPGHHEHDEHDEHDGRGPRGHEVGEARVVALGAHVALRRMRFVGWVAGWLAALAPLAFAFLRGLANAPVPGGSFMHTPPWVANAELVVILGGLCSLVVWAISRLVHGGLRGEPATLAVSPRALHVRRGEGPPARGGDADVELVPRAALREVRPLPAGVVLRTRSRDVEVLAPPSAIAALLGALELSVGARAVRFPIASVAGARASTLGSLAGVATYVTGAFACGGLYALGRGVMGLARGLVGAGVVASSTWGALLALVPLLLCFRLFAERSVVVGADALRVDGLVRRRLIPLADVASVDERGDDVWLELRDGRRERLPKGGFSLARRIHEALALHARGGDALPAALVRGERTTREWADALASLVRAGPSYRAASVDPERLLRVAEDPAGSAATRAAAAVALASSDEPSVRARLRVAAQASADLELEAVLEQAAAGEADLAALERLSAREAKR